ncbi:MAG: hypothetical protein ACOX6V_04040 [Patescibacteria group bacterium]|jgi:hypothetical protein
MKQLQFIEKNSSFQTTKQEFDSLLKNSKAVIFVRISFFILLVSWLLLAVFYMFLPPQVPLFFSKPWGEEQLVTKQHLAIVPGIASFLFIVNARLASMAVTKEKLLAFIFLTTQTVVSLIGCITLIRLILLLA